MSRPIVTLDTNVLYAALYSRLGASHAILQHVLDGELAAALTSPVYFEYYDVLTRPENLRTFGLTTVEVETLLDSVALLAKKHQVYYLLRPNLFDESDNIFLECAFASNSTHLITSNKKHFEKGELFGFEKLIVTPAEFMRRTKK